MGESGLSLRHAARAGFDGPTAGRAPGFTQAHLVVVPKQVAAEFADFCEANPVACPLLAQGRPGDARLPVLGEDLDIRTDVPGYLVHRNGVAASAADLHEVWHDDLVAMAIGSWSGVEAALAAAGIRLRRLEPGRWGPRYRSWIPAVPAGRFGGSIVVSMRPVGQEDVRRIASITGRLPRSHGAPIHRGHPAHLGILDAAQPDWEEALLPRPGEECLFWASGLTALVALQVAKLPFFATNAPGRLLVTDLPDEVPKWR